MEVDGFFQSFGCVAEAVDIVAMFGVDQALLVEDVGIFGGNLGGNLEGFEDFAVARLEFGLPFLDEEAGECFQLFTGPIFPRFRIFEGIETREVLCEGNFFQLLLDIGWLIHGAPRFVNKLNLSELSQLLYDRFSKSKTLPFG